jgi:hypothetical protein
MQASIAEMSAMLLDEILEGAASSSAAPNGRSVPFSQHDVTAALISGAWSSTDYQMLKMCRQVLR